MKYLLGKELTQQPILHIDATPDDDYVLRILRTYRANCGCEYVSSNDNPVFEALNSFQRKRAKLLDVAIKKLEKN